MVPRRGVFAVTGVAVGAVACAIWLYLLVARGRFWRAEPADTDAPLLDREDEAPAVIAIVPARDEAKLIGASVRSLLQQDYPGALSVVLVDDESSDGTAEAARRAADACGAAERLTVLRTPPREPGWTGKLWALHCGTAHVQALPKPAELLLFTDADIVHARDSVRALVSRARRDALCLASLMAYLRCTSFAERAFVPAFVFFFRMLYPFAWVNDRNARTAAAAGGCMLIDRIALARAGGVAAVRGALIDDCALAALMKAQGPIFLGLTERVHSARPYEALTDIRRMIVRSAYAQLRFSPAFLALTVLAMGVTFLAPPLLAVFGGGIARVLGAAAWLQMALAFQPTLRFYRVSPWWGLSLPAIAAAYLVFTLDSAYQASRGRAGQWKGRVYPARRA